MKRPTTSAHLPAEIRALYRLDPIEGGPRFALPHYGLTEVDFSRLSVAEAETLLRNCFPYLHRRPAAIAPDAEQKTAAPVIVKTSKKRRE